MNSLKPFLVNLLPSSPLSVPKHAGKWFNTSASFSKTLALFIYQQYLTARSILSPAILYVSQHPSFPMMKTSCFVMFGTTASIGLCVSARRLYRTVTNSVFTISKGQGFSNKGEGRLITRAQKDFTEYMFRSLISINVFVRDLSYVTFLAGVLMALSDYMISPVTLSYGVFGNLIFLVRRITKATLRLRWLHPDVLYVYGSALVTLRLLSIFKSSRSNTSIQIVNTVNNYASATAPTIRTVRTFDYPVLLATLDEYSGFRRRAKAFVQLLEMIPSNGLLPSILLWWRRPVPEKDKTHFLHIFTFPIRILLVSIIGKEYFTIPDLLAPPSEFTRPIRFEPATEVSRRDPPDASPSTPAYETSLAPFVPFPSSAETYSPLSKEESDLRAGIEASLESELAKVKTEKSKDEPISPSVSSSPKEEKKDENDPGPPRQSTTVSPPVTPKVDRPTIPSHFTRPTGPPVSPEIKKESSSSPSLPRLMPPPTKKPKKEGESSSTPPTTAETFTSTKNLVEDRAVALAIAASLSEKKDIPAEITSSIQSTVVSSLGGSHPMSVHSTPETRLIAQRPTFPENARSISPTLLTQIKKLDPSSFRELHDVDLRIATVAADNLLVEGIFGFEGSLSSPYPTRGFTQHVQPVRDPRYIIKVPYKILQNNYFFSDWIMASSNSGKLGRDIGAAMFFVQETMTKAAPTPFRALLELQKFSTELHVPYEINYGYGGEGDWLLHFADTVLKTHSKIFELRSPQTLSLTDFSRSSHGAHPGWMNRCKERFVNFETSFSINRTWAHEVFTALKEGKNPERLKVHTFLALPVVKKSGSRKPDLETRCRLAMIPESWHRVLYRAAFFNLRQHIERLDPGKDWTSKFSLFYNVDKDRPSSLELIAKRFNRTVGHDSRYKYISWDTSDHGASIGPHVFDLLEKWLSLRTRFEDGSPTDHFWKQIWNEQCHSNLAVPQKDNEGECMLILKKHWGLNDGTMDTGLIGSLASIFAIGHVLYKHFKNKANIPDIISNLTAEIHGDNISFAATGEIASILSFEYNADLEALKEFGFTSKKEEFSIQKEIEDIEIMSWYPHKIHNSSTYVGVKSVTHALKSLYYCEQIISDPPTPANVRYMADITVCLYIMHFWNPTTRQVLDIWWKHLQQYADAENVIMTHNHSMRDYLDFRGFVMPHDSFSSVLSADNPYPPEEIRKLWLGPKYKTLAARSPQTFRERPLKAFIGVDLPTNDIRDLLLTGFMSEQDGPRSFLGSLTPHFIYSGASSAYGHTTLLDVQNFFSPPPGPQTDIVFISSTLGGGFARHFLSPRKRRLIFCLAPALQLFSLGIACIISTNEQKLEVLARCFHAQEFFVTCVTAPISEEYVKRIPIFGKFFSHWIGINETARNHAYLESTPLAAFHSFLHGHLHVATSLESLPVGIGMHALWNILVYVNTHISMPLMALALSSRAEIQPP